MIVVDVSGRCTQYGSNTGASHRPVIDRPIADFRDKTPALDQFLRID